MTYQPPRDPTEPARQRRILTTPHRLKTVLQEGLSRIDTRTELAHVKYVLSQHATRAHKRPRAKLLSTITSKQAYETSRQLESGLDLIDLARSADPFIRPMLAYYGCEQFLGAASRAFMSWEGTRSHGLRCIVTALAQTCEVAIEADGFFPRLADTFAIVTGKYNLFSARDAGSSPICDTTRRPPNGWPARPVVTLLLPTRVSLQALATYDPVAIAAAPKSLREAASMNHDPFDPITNTMLVDVLIAFIAGSLCRYNPILWRQVLDGEKTDIRIEVDGALDRISTFLVEGVMQWMLTLNSSSLVSHGSTYSKIPHEVQKLGI